MENELITYWAIIKWFVFDYKFSILFLVLYPYFYYTLSPLNYKKNKIKRDNETIGRIVFTICGRTIVIINLPFFVVFFMGVLLDLFIDGDITTIELTGAVLSEFSSWHNEAGGFFYSFGRFINHIDIAIFYCLFAIVFTAKKEVKKRDDEEKRSKREEAKRKRIKKEAAAKKLEAAAKKLKEDGEKEKLRKKIAEIYHRWYPALIASEHTKEYMKASKYINKERRIEIHDRYFRTQRLCDYNQYDHDKNNHLSLNVHKDVLDAYERVELELKATIKLVEKQKKLLINESETRFGYDQSHEVIKSFKNDIICLDMPMEMVDFLKGEKFNRKRSVSKKGTTERYNYQPYESSRGNTKYKLEVDFQDGLVIKFQDL